MNYFKRQDLIVVAAVIGLSLLIWTAYRIYHREKPAKAEIYYKSRLVETIDLTTGKEKVFSVPQNENVLFHLSSDGSIRFEKSDCPDQICVLTGKLHMVGQYAACLPNHMVLKIISGGQKKDDDLDIIVGK